MPNSKDKGSTFERWVAKSLRVIFPEVKTSRLMSKDADDRGVDLVRTGNLAVQTKHYAKNTPNDWKVIEAMDTKDIKIYVKKVNYKPALAVLEFEDLIKLLKK